MNKEGYDIQSQQKQLQIRAPEADEERATGNMKYMNLDTFSLQHFNL